MDNDISGVGLMVVVFLLALAVLIFGMDWLEDRMDAPPSRLSRWLRGRHRQPQAPGAIEADLPEPPAIPQQRAPESAPSPPLSTTLPEPDPPLGNTAT